MLPKPVLPSLRTCIGYENRQTIKFGPNSTLEKHSMSRVTRGEPNIAIPWEVSSSLLTPKLRVASIMTVEFRQSKRRVSTWAKSSCHNPLYTNRTGPMYLRQLIWKAMRRCPDLWCPRTETYPLKLDMMRLSKNGQNRCKMQFLETDSIGRYHGKE